MKSKKENLIKLVTVVSFVFFLAVIVISRITDLPDLVSQIAGALLGAVITAVMTYALLAGQTSAEEVKERNVKVFEEKSRAFKEFIDTFWECWSDFILEPEELEKIRQLFYRNIYIYLSNDSLEKIAKNLSALSQFVGKTLVDEEKEHARSHIFEIIRILKEEVGLQHEKVNTSLLSEIDKAFQKTVDEVEKKEQESIIETEQGNATFWHYVLHSDEQLDVLKTKNVIAVGDGDEEGQNRTRLFSNVSKGDMLFIYSRGSGYIGLVRAESGGKQIPKGDPRRVFMGPTEGFEAQVETKPLVLLEKKYTIGRDVPRLKTLQRIYDKAAILNLTTKLGQKEVEAEGKVCAEMEALIKILN